MGSTAFLSGVVALAAFLPHTTAGSAPPPSSAPASSGAAPATGGTGSAGGATGGAAGGAAGGSSASYDPLSYLQYVGNIQYADTSLVTLAAIVVALIIYRLVLGVSRHVRTLVCLTDEKQRYFRNSTPWHAAVKKHLIYAPLFRFRHHGEIRLFRFMNVGVTPSRFQTLFLLGVIAMNTVFCFYGIEWQFEGTSEQGLMLKHLRNRAGTLALVNMIPLVIMAGRNNPLISWLSIPFDTFNLMHRWFGRIAITQVLLHFVFFMVGHVQASGWASLKQTFTLTPSTVVPVTGLIAGAAAVALLLSSLSPVRRAFYEFFLHIHIALVVMMIAALWYHLAGTPNLIYVQAITALWAVERAKRLLTLVYRNVGKGGTKAILEPLPGDAVRITLTLARPWRFRPGQFMYLTIPSIGLWTGHPFSVAWAEDETEEMEVASDPDRFDDIEKGMTAVVRRDLPTGRTTISGIIRRREGFTHQLSKRAAKAINGHVAVTAFVEGPYGGLHSLHSYGTVLLFAGGVGITHQVPYMRELVAGFANGTLAARRVTLVWCVTSTDCLDWIRPWMTSILAMDRRRDVLRIQIYVTQPTSTKEIRSPSTTIQMFPGRADVHEIVETESQSQIGAMAVSVCGPGRLADDVRRAVRHRQDRNIDFVEESFSW